MGFTVAQTYLADILHVVAQSLLAPDIILLLGFILYALFCIGSVVAEYFTERKHFKVVMPRFLAALMASKEEDIPQVIEHSGLLKRQKDALNTVYEYRALPGDALVALVRRLVNEEETRYDRITGRNNMAAKVTPMLGLMGTLIPLGPGIQALGTADTAALSSSLLVAFDTTVAGLVTAAICLVVGKIRSNWYNNYLSALDAAMATMMEKIEDGRETSTATLPEGAESYKFLFDVPDEPKKDEAKEDAAKEEPANEQSEAKADEPAGVEAAGEAADDAPTPFAAYEKPAPAPEIAVVPLGDALVFGNSTGEAVEQAAEPEVSEPEAPEVIEAAETPETPEVSESLAVDSPVVDSPVEIVEQEVLVEEEEVAETAEPTEVVESIEPTEAVDPTEPIAELAPEDPAKPAFRTGFVFGPKRDAEADDKPSQTI